MSVPRARPVPGPPSAGFYSTMVGEGAYDGLVGSMLMTDHDGAGGWQVTGTIFPKENAPSE